MTFNFRGEFEGEPPTPEEIGRVLREVYALLKRGSLPPERPSEEERPPAKANTAHKQRKKKEGSEASTKG